jgi:hypothetical protein
MSASPLSWVLSKLGRATIKSWVLEGLLVGAIIAMWFGGIDFLLVVLVLNGDQIVIAYGAPT